MRAGELVGHVNVVVDLPVVVPLVLGTDPLDTVEIPAAVPLDRNRVDLAEEDAARIELMAAQAAKLAIQLAAGESDATQSRIYTPTLINRHSVAPVRAG